MSNDKERRRSIPAELAGLPQWVCWGKPGAQRKCPFNPRTGTTAKAGRPDTWADLATAAQAVKAGRFEGIGFEFAEGGGIVGVDFDHCIDAGGQLSDWAAGWVERLNSYTEISPSGTGLHVYCRGKLPGPSVKRPRCEMYDRARYFTVTAQPWGSLRPLRDAGEAITDLYEELQAEARKGQDKPTERRSAPAAAVDIEDAPLLAKLQRSKSGPVFSALWAGDASAYPSRSEADIALCNILAWWTNGDAERVDRLFRQSGLMRAKWDRRQSGTTYGAITVANACNTVRGGYDPAAYFRQKAAQDFAPISESSESGQPAEPVTLVTLAPDTNERYSWTDIGNGNLFADWYKDAARYVPERKQWFTYDGRAWRPDVGGLRVMELCKRLADGLNLYALGIEDERQRGAYLKHVLKWQSRRNRETVLKDAAGVYPVPLACFDADPWLLNCQNGTLDLRTRAFKPHSPHDFLSLCAGVEYDPAARCERWERFVNEIMQGDADRAAFLQKALGYALTGDTAFECFFILYGPTSRNGKGTCMETFRRLLGDYGRAAKPDTIAMRQTVNGAMPSEDIARLAGARFVNISEPDKRLVLSAALVKTLTGNDTITARFLHENSFEFRPQFKLFVNTNHLPQVTDVTLFSSGRVKLIPFDRHFTDAEQDTGLKAALAKPESLSGILNWCLEGLWMIGETGFDMPDAVQAATDAYRQRSDKMGRFVAECLVPDPMGEITTTAAYSAYTAWCRQNGQFAESMANFKTELAQYAEIKRKRPAGSSRAEHPQALVLGCKLQCVPVCADFSS